MFAFILHNIDYVTSTAFHGVDKGKNSKFIQTIYEKCIELERELLFPTSSNRFSEEYIEEFRDIQTYYHLVKTVKTNFALFMK